MPLTERSRSALFRGLTQIIDDEEAVDEMLSNFPARAVEEPASDDFARAEIALVHAEIALVRAEIAASEQRLMAYVHAEIRAAMQWTIGAMVGLSGLVIASVSALA